MGFNGRHLNPIRYDYLLMAEFKNIQALLDDFKDKVVAEAKKGGVLHDIGKAVDHEIQGTHPEIGHDIGKKFKLSENVINCIAHHHDDEVPSIETVIVKVADAMLAQGVV